MKIYEQTLLTMLLLAGMAMIQNSTGEPLHILPLGDSITQGGRHGREEYTYRWPLFKKLVDAGVDFDFIGSLNKGLDANAAWPKEYKGKPFDMDHEGVYGIKTAKALARLPEAMKKWPAAPDIVLIHLGTNDQKAPDHAKAVVEPLKAIVGMIREKNPKAVFLISHLNFNGGNALTIRPLVESMAKELNTTTSPVITVHMYEEWKENPKHAETDTFDWAHPNPKGQEKMAAKWLEAMQPFLK